MGQRRSVKQFRKMCVRFGTLIFSLGLHALVLFLIIEIVPPNASTKTPQTISVGLAFSRASVPQEESQIVTVEEPGELVVPKIKPKAKKPKAVHQKIRVSQSKGRLAKRGQHVAGTRAIGGGSRSFSGVSTHGVAPSFAPVLRSSPQLVNGHEVKIPYPERAKRLMIEGIVKLKLTVSEAGRVIKAEILSGPAFGLRNSALQVAENLFFLPATDEYGRARTAEIEHEVVFRLLPSRS